MAIFDLFGGIAFPHAAFGAGSADHAPNEGQHVEVRRLGLSVSDVQICTWASTMPLTGVDSGARLFEPVMAQSSPAPAVDVIHSRRVIEFIGSLRF